MKIFFFFLFENLSLKFLKLFRAQLVKEKLIIFDITMFY